MGQLFLLCSLPAPCAPLPSSLAGQHMVKTSQLSATETLAVLAVSAAVKKINSLPELGRTDIILHYETAENVVFSADVCIFMV